MKIKTKLNFGVGLLFLFIVILGVMGGWYTNKLKMDTENILHANYNSLEYSRNMLTELEMGDSISNRKFGENLVLQESNITEIGEKRRTEDLRGYFELYNITPNDSGITKSMRICIHDIMEMNMEAIERKSKLAEKTADNATFWIAIVGTLCFLVAFTLLVNLPANIANPIRELTASIRQIAAGNYTQRVFFESSSEFGELAGSFNSMATKLEEYNNSNLAQIMIEKKRIETLINNMNDPVIGLDENLQIIFANEKAIHIIGEKQEELIGRSAQELAVHNDLTRLLIRDIISVPGVEKNNKVATVKIFADGKESYFEKQTLHISVVPTGEENKKLIGHVIILRNVTEYKELDFAKTNFIATVSHEFKTPISSIKMSLHLLENEQVGKLNTEQHNLFQNISADVDRLLKITGELLNMTQVESGNIQLSVIPSVPSDIMMYAVNATKTQAESRNIRFEINCANQLPLVNADHEKTAWVLTNLITNAIHYSYDNSVIYLQIRQEGEKIVFSVRDTGQGISPQYKDKIFDRYFRVPGSASQGTGLGLAISKEFIEAQGGNIEVSSEYGSGSTFSVTLNRAF